ncbi:MAG: OmpA family protein [Spirochaetaceae bacterium]|jgi:outer membrane protein OmpA-like peptidoglycan-associated protein|nr:OmpA family protein [Spirochaetaceae bacterium]
MMYGISKQKIRVVPDGRGWEKIRKLRAIFFVLILGIPRQGWGETFVYKHEIGNKYRILSVVHEDVYINRIFSHRARILNRVSVEITGLEGESARHHATFTTSEELLEGGGVFHWGNEYVSVFDRDRQGRMTIEPQYYMPVVRNVPVFPGRDIQEGETWTAEGSEMHDFREAFGIEQPYRIPFEATYTFLGNRTWGGRRYPVFSVSYRIFYEPPAAMGRVWPRRIMGSSDQMVYWDPEIGQALVYDENFRMIFELSNGTTVEYRGQAWAQILESEIMKKEEAAQTIADEINRLGINDASVRIVDEGITISLENIQFQPDSAILLASEKEKLDKIGDILMRFADRDILVGGHTALAGTAAGRMKLSQDRAAAVASYLISKGVRESPRVVIRGYGAERPVADNSTAEGMRRNRRVEITLLEN